MKPTKGTTPSAQTAGTAVDWAVDAHRFRVLVERAHDLIVVLDATAVIRYKSPSVRRVLGRAPEEFIGKSVFDELHPDDHAAAVHFHERMLAEPGATHRAEMRLRHSSGDWRLLDFCSTNLLHDPDVRGIVVNARDVTEMRNAGAQYQNLFVDNPQPLWVVHETSLRFLAVNDAAVQHYGYTRDEFLGMSLHDLWLSDGGTPIEEMLVGDRSGAPRRARHRKRNGDLLDVEVTAHRTTFDGQPAQLTLVLDVTQRRRLEERLTHEASHDVLTGLPNRALLRRRLGRALQRAKRRPEYHFALLFLDLDRFKLVNDSLGHLVGDALLRDFADRLEACVRPSDTVARLGGDEFAILLHDLSDPTDVMHLADRIHSMLRTPFTLEGHEAFTSASIGVTLSTTGYDTPEAVLRDADIAMYRAKELGGGQHMLFDAEMHAHAVAVLALETDLRRAVERNELRVLYQPILEIGTLRIAGFEALVRWSHPERGAVGPAVFIPVAEETGLVMAIDRFVLRRVCEDVREWEAEGTLPPQVTVSVNVSGRNLSQATLAEDIAALAREHEVIPARLQLEITESAVMANAELAAATLARLRQFGVGLAIDDFGTGYSSLSYLQRFPVDTLKIDRLFVSQIGTGTEQLEIVRAIMALAHNLNMRVTAEGVETGAQLAQLRRLGCELAQGYLFWAPLEREGARELLRGNLTWAGDQSGPDS